MEFAANTGLYYGGGDFMDAEVAMQDLLQNSQLEQDLEPIDWQLDTCSPTDNLSDEYRGGLLYDENALSSGPEIVSPEAGSRCRNAQGSCVSLATDVLNSMHTISSNCILGMMGEVRERQAPPPSRGVDGILSMNQSALQTVRSILACPCYGRPQVLLVVSVMCSEILALFRQLLDIYSHHQHLHANHLGVPASGGRAEVEIPDFFVGSHRVGKDMAATLVRQMLSSMLQELQVVIEDIACRTGNSSSGVNELGAEPGVDRVRATMGAFLNMQIPALKTALAML